MGDTQKSQTISAKLHPIAEQAKQHPERIFISLAHLIDINLLRGAYEKTRKNSAAGVLGREKQYYKLHRHIKENKLSKVLSKNEVKRILVRKEKKTESLCFQKTF